MNFDCERARKVWSKNSFLSYVCRSSCIKQYRVSMLMNAAEIYLQLYAYIRFVPRATPILNQLIEFLIIHIFMYFYELFC